MQKAEIYIENIQQTKILATKLAKIAKLGDIITFSGNLGAGKTSFIQYFVRSIAGDEIDVTSPTFNLLHIYQCPTIEIWHFDLYRLKYLEEIRELGMEYAFRKGITLIEWPEIIRKILPRDRLELKLSFAEEENARVVSFSGYGKWAEVLTEQLIKDHLP